MEHGQTLSTIDIGIADLPAAGRQVKNGFFLTSKIDFQALGILSVMLK